MSEPECGATSIEGVSSYDTPAYRKCILPLHGPELKHKDHEGFEWEGNKSGDFMPEEIEAYMRDQEWWENRIGDHPDVS